MTPCLSHDPDTGLRCMKEKGHDGPHWVEIEWELDDEAEDDLVPPSQPQGISDSADRGSEAP